MSEGVSTAQCLEEVNVAEQVLPSECGGVRGRNRVANCFYWGRHRGGVEVVVCR